MIVSELCSNGDLFDYVRNVTPPTMHKVVCQKLWCSKFTLIVNIVEAHA